jgi:TonB family protein
MAEKLPFAWGYSLLGTLLQIAVIEATQPIWTRLPPCIDCHAVPTALISDWIPIIENMGKGDRFSNEERCPGPQSAGTHFRIDRAPLPAAFRPFDYSDTVLACVRLDAAGSVRSVKLISGTGRVGLDRELLRAIVRQWHFEPREGMEVRSGWQRIRLSSRAPEAIERLEPAYSSGDDVLDDSTHPDSN